MALKHTLNNFISAVNARLDAFKNSVSIHGDTRYPGAVRRNIFQGVVYTLSSGYTVGDMPRTVYPSDSNIYLHLCIPTNTLRDNHMFWFNIRGYSFGSSWAVNEFISGYSYSPSNALLNVGVSGNANTTVYKDSNNNVVLRLLFPSIYYTTVEVDTMQVGNGPLYAKGSLRAQLSTASTVVFS